MPVSQKQSDEKKKQNQKANTHKPNIRDNGNRSKETTFEKLHRRQKLPRKSSTINCNIQTTAMAKVSPVKINGFNAFVIAFTFVSSIKFIGRARKMDKW